MRQRSHEGPAPGRSSVLLGLFFLACATPVCSQEISARDRQITAPPDCTPVEPPEPRSPANPEAVANEVSASASDDPAPGSETPTTRRPDTVIFTPGDSNEGLLPTREIEAWREVFDRGTVARSGGGVRSLRQMELDYREPTWPHALSDDLVSRVIEDATQENSALPDSTISFTYRLAPYVVEIGDRYHARTPLRWELLTLDRHRGLASPRGFYDVDQALAASLAMVGHRQEAETLGVRAFARRQFERGSADVLTQRSALLLVRLYHLWDRDEEAFYRRWMPLF